MYLAKRFRTPTSEAFMSPHPLPLTDQRREARVGRSQARPDAGGLLSRNWPHPAGDSMEGSSCHPPRPPVCHTPTLPQGAA